MSEKVA